MAAQWLPFVDLLNAQSVGMLVKAMPDWVSGPFSSI